MIRTDERYTTADMPIFRDAGHALHVSYLIHSMPARTVSPTAIVIDQLVKENHVWDGLPEPRQSGIEGAPSRALVLSALQADAPSARQSGTCSPG